MSIHLFSAEVGGYFAPVVGVPLADLGGVTIGAEPVLGAVDIVPQFGGGGILWELAFTHFLPHPRESIDRVGVDNLVEMVFLQIAEAMNDGKELADIVGALGCLIMEDTRTRGDIDALILHHAGIAAAGRIDGEGIEDGDIGGVGIGTDGGEAFVVDEEDVFTSFTSWTS